MSELVLRPQTTQALATCTYCPSLCRHACPVATATGRDTVSPWGLMSYARTLQTGQSPLSSEAIQLLQHCVGCGACTSACKHEVPVAQTLVDVRRALHQQQPGLPSWPTEEVSPLPAPWLERMRLRSRVEDLPQYGLILQPEAEELALVEELFDICDLLEVEQFGLSPHFSALSVGEVYWKAGEHARFVEVARTFFHKTESAPVLVFLSAEQLYIARDIYPRFGLRLRPALMHVSELLAPVLLGGELKRSHERVLAFDGCHLERKLHLEAITEQIYNRITTQPIERAAKYLTSATAACCGGTCSGPTEALGESLARELLQAAERSKVSEITTFSAECARSLRRIPSSVRITHAISLLARTLLKHRSS